MNESSFETYAKPTRVAVMGTGLVGSTYAYTILLQGLCDEICLIDQKADKAKGEAMDLNHTLPFTRRTGIWAGTPDDLSEADLIMISAGTNQRPGQSRMDLLRENAGIVGDIAEEAGAKNPGSILLVTTNPVDVMTYVAMKRSGMDPAQVLGSGTALDTARLRFLVGSDLGVDPRSVHAYVMGEHGDSEMVAWSRAQVAGTGIDDWPDMDEPGRRSIEDDVRGAAYQVIRLKGATYYAIAMTLAKITEAVLKDSRTVMSVSTYLTGQYGIYDVYLGAPAIVGRSGVLRTLEIPLDKNELSALQESGRVVRNAIESTGIGRRELTGAAASFGSFESSGELAPKEPHPLAASRPPEMPTSRRVMKHPRKLL